MNDEEKLSSAVLRKTIDTLEKQLKKCYKLNGNINFLYVFDDGDGNIKSGVIGNSKQVLYLLTHFHCMLDKCNKEDKNNDFNPGEN
jgi:hypothetical protein